MARGGRDRSRGYKVTGILSKAYSDKVIRSSRRSTITTHMTLIPHGLVYI